MRGGQFTGTIAAVCVAFIAAVPANAAPPPQSGVSNPSSLTLSGSFRARYETLAGQARAGLPAEDELLSLRTTVLADFSSGPVRLGGELYDSRAYAAPAGGSVSANDVNALELVQAYAAVDLDSPLGDGSAASVQAGRFVLDLGSRRLVAADDYRNTTSGFTGMRADLSAGRMAATAIYTLPQVRLPDDPDAIRDNKVVVDRQSFDLVFWGGIVRRTGLFRDFLADLSYFRLAERDRPDMPTRDRRLHTIDLHLGRAPRPGRVDADFEGAYQFGTIRAGAAPDAALLRVAASFVHAEIGYRWRHGWAPRISVAYDRASGDGSGRRFGRFDTLFGTRRGDLAPSGIFAVIGRTNLSSPGVRFEAAPGDRLEGFIAYRGLWLAARNDAFSTSGVRDPTGDSGSFAGHLVDTRLRYWLLPKILRLELNAAAIAKRRFLKRAPNAPDTGNERYLAISVATLF